MSSGQHLQVDAGDLPRLAGELRVGAAALDEAGAEIPAAPDAGESTAVVAEGMAGLTEMVAVLVSALDSCGAGVEEDGKHYRAAERSNEDSFSAKPV